MHSSASTRMRTACGTPSSRRVSRASNTLHFSKYMAVHNIPPVLDHLVARLAEIQPSDPLKQMYTDLGDLLGLAQRASEPEQRQDQPEASTACRLDLSGKFVDREGRIKPIRLHMAVDRTAFTLARARAWIALVEAEINTAILPRPSTDGIRTSGGGLEEGWGRARAQTADTAGYGRSATRERDQNGDGERRVLIVEEEEDGGDREGGREEKTLEREGGRTGGEQQRGKRDTGTPEPREKRESKAGKGGLLRTLFDELDADGDGSLTSSELEAGLTRLGLQPTAESLALVQASVGLQAGDEMPFEQFKTAAQKLMAGTDAASESWTTLRWLEGLSGEGKTLAAAFAHALQVPPGYQGSQFEFVKSLSANQTELQRRLADPKCQDMVVSVVRHHVDALARQEASTAAEMNAKFSASIEEMFSYGGREVYEGGLNEHIGTPNDLDPVEEIFREHCVYEYACAMAIVTRNYGITTDPTQEFRAVAGRWTPTDRSFLPVDGFEIPPETQNLSSDEHRRRFLGVPELMELDSAVQAGLQEPEVVAVRLWTGPMYQVYNGILRNGVKDQFTTTLHALSSAIYKLSRIAKPEMVYRGLGGRAIPQDLLGKGVVEYGAQSFTTDKNVAVGYAKMLSGDPGTIRPTYVFEVLEGEVDKGADVSELSFYPHEKEKLYGPLAMMQPVSDSIDESTLVIRMRVNVNQKAGTLDEVRARRKQLLVGTANTLHRETGSRKDVALIEAAGGGEGASRRADLRAVREGFEQRGDAAWFNDPGNFRLANNALLGAWEGVLNHAELWGEVEDLVADEYVQRMEEELGREGQGKSLELRKERAEDQKRVEALKGMEASREEVGVLVKRRRRDLEAAWQAADPPGASGFKWGVHVRTARQGSAVSLRSNRVESCLEELLVLDDSVGFARGPGEEVQLDTGGVPGAYRDEHRMWMEVAWLVRAVLRALDTAWELADGETKQEVEEIARELKAVEKELDLASSQHGMDLRGHEDEDLEQDPWQDEVVFSEEDPLNLGGPSLSNPNVDALDQIVAASAGAVKALWRLTARAADTDAAAPIEIGSLVRLEGEEHAQSKFAGCVGEVTDVEDGQAFVVFKGLGAAQFAVGPSLNVVGQLLLPPFISLPATRSGAREKYGGQFAELFTNVVKDPHKEMVEVVSAAIRMYASAASPAIQAKQAELDSLMQPPAETEAQSGTSVMSAWEVAYGRCKTVLDANAAWLSAAWAIDAAEGSDSSRTHPGRILSDLADSEHATLGPLARLLHLGVFANEADFPSGPSNASPTALLNASNLMSEVVSAMQHASKTSGGAQHDADLVQIAGDRLREIAKMWERRLGLEEEVSALRGEACRDQVEAMIASLRKRPEWITKARELKGQLRKLKLECAKPHLLEIATAAKNRMRAHQELVELERVVSQVADSDMVYRLEAELRELETEHRRSVAALDIAIDYNAVDEYYSAHRDVLEVAWTWMGDGDLAPRFERLVLLGRWNGGQMLRSYPDKARLWPEVSKLMHDAISAMQAAVKRDAEQSDEGVGSEILRLEKQLKAAERAQYKDQLELEEEAAKHDVEAFLAEHRVTLEAGWQVAQEEEEEDDFPGMESGGADSDDTILGSLVVLGKWNGGEMWKGFGGDGVRVWKEIYRVMQLVEQELGSSRGGGGEGEQVLRGEIGGLLDRQSEMLSGVSTAVMLTDINSFFQHHRSQLGYIWTQYTDWADMPLKEGHRVDGWGKVAGRIKRVHDDGSVDIDWEDGEKERRVATDHITRHGPFRNLVELGQWSRGYLDEKLQDDDCELACVFWLLKESVAALESAGTTHTADADPRLVEKLSVTAAKVRKMAEEDQTRLQAHSAQDLAQNRLGEEAWVMVQNAWVYATQSRERFGVDKNERIMARWKGGPVWCPGRISSVNKQGLYDVKYDDGDFEAGVRGEFIRALDATALEKLLPSFLMSDEVREGSFVEVNWKGKGRWHKGRVNRIHPDGTLHVRLDDGDEEESTAPERVRLRRTRAKKGEAGVLDAVFAEGDLARFEAERRTLLLDVLHVMNQGIEESHSKPEGAVPPGDGNEAAFKAACATHATQIAAAWGRLSDLADLLPLDTSTSPPVLVGNGGLLSAAYDAHERAENSGRFWGEATALVEAVAKVAGSRDSQLDDAEVESACRPFFLRCSALLQDVDARARALARGLVDRIGVVAKNTELRAREQQKLEEAKRELLDVQCALGAPRLREILHCVDEVIACKEERARLEQRVFVMRGHARLQALEAIAADVRQRIRGREELRSLRDTLRRARADLLPQERLREVCEEAELRIEQHEKLRKKEREISQPLHVMRRRSVSAAARSALQALPTTHLARQETSARFRAALAVLRQATRTLPLKSPGDADVTKGMCEAFEGEHASTLTDELKTKHHLRLEIERLDALLGPPDNPVDADRYWRQRKNLTMRIAGKAQDRHSVMRCLEMLELGLSASHTVALDVQDEWEARHFAALCLRPNYVGSFPVTQIATGEVQQLSLASLSEIEAAFLAHVIAFTAAQAIAVSVEGSKHIKVAPLFRPAPEQSRPRNSEISPGRLVTQESAPEGLAVQPVEAEAEEGEKKGRASVFDEEQVSDDAAENIIGGGLWQHVDGKTLDLRRKKIGVGALRLLVEATMAWGGKPCIGSRQRQYAVGDIVEVKGRRGGVLGWAVGVVQAVNGNDSYSVDVEGEGNIRADASEDLQKMTRLREGHGVRMEVRAGKVVMGTVTGVNVDGTFNVALDGGGSEKGVGRKALAVIPGAEALLVGQPVRAAKSRARGGGASAAGEVMAVNKDRSYAIRFEDGDVEQRVVRSRVEVVSISSVEVLDLSENPPLGLGGDETAALIMQLACLLPDLRELLLSDCGMKDSGVMVLAEEIQKGGLHPLQSLTLTGEGQDIAPGCQQTLQEAWQRAGKKISCLKVLSKPSATATASARNLPAASQNDAPANNSDGVPAPVKRRGVKAHSPPGSAAPPARNAPRKADLPAVKAGGSAQEGKSDRRSSTAAETGQR